VLVLPVVPREENSFPLTLKETQAGFAPFPGLSVDLAFGEAYPRTVRLRWEGGSILREDGRFLSVVDGFSFSGVTSESATVAATLLDEGSFELTVSEVGRFSVLLEGNWLPETDDAPSARAFSVELTVNVGRVVSVGWGPCVSRLVRVIENAPFRMHSFRLSDENSPWFSPVNVDPSSSVEVTVHAAPGTTLTADDGLGSLVATGPEQTISVRALGSEIGSFELVHLSSVDGFGARFFFSAPWQRGSTEVFSGDTARAPRPGETPGHIGVAPSLSIGGVDVCSVALPEWFEVRTDTPETCTTTGELGCGEACSLSALPVVVLAENPGTCELSVAAPELNGGLGMSAGLSVELIPLE
jgi:hypothetical protein